MSEAADINTTPPRQPEESQPLSSSRARSLPAPANMYDILDGAIVAARAAKEVEIRKLNFHAAALFRDMERGFLNFQRMLLRHPFKGPEGIGKDES